MKNFITKPSDLEFGDVFIGTLNVDLPDTGVRAAQFNFYQIKKMKARFILPNNFVFGLIDLHITFDFNH